MSMLKNKHVVVAALVAPLLALIAYFSIDYLFGEKPHAAVPGQSYPLVETPKCRYASGSCGMKNNEFELQMTFERLGGGLIRLDLSSEYPLEGVAVAVAQSEADDKPPRAMNPEDDSGRTWSAELSVQDPERDRIRLAATAAGVHYFGDVSTRFTQEAEGD
jgi:hypothetical protein